MKIVTNFAPNVEKFMIKTSKLQLTSYQIANIEQDAIF